MVPTLETPDQYPTMVLLQPRNVRSGETVMPRAIAIAVLLLAAPVLLVTLSCSSEEAPPAAQPLAWPPNFIHSRGAVTMGGWHSTTRGTIRLVHPVDGRWLVFRGDPNSYHFSDDGIAWTAAEAAQASRSHLVDGGNILTFYQVQTSAAPDFAADRFICRGTIADNTITWQLSLIHI